MSDKRTALERALKQVHSAYPEWATEVDYQAIDDLIEAARAEGRADRPTCSTCRHLGAPNRAWKYCARHGDLSFGDDQDQLIVVVGCRDHEPREGGE